MRRLVLAAFLGLIMSVGAHAVEVVFDFTALGGFGGDPLNLSQSESFMGVDFTANVSLDGSGMISTDEDGWGLLGGPSFEINTNESIVFSATATGATGGNGNWCHRWYRHV